ncbi:radical SAM protein [Sphaerisporangium sp. NPDC049003]|uniref:radical SAM protein n=1 Tax=Sphaerisporangium sp. NPDC049003 TaxID=3364517 RepID=UPI003711E996
MTVLTHATNGPALLGWHLELELTGRCQLECVHCYAESGPTGDHGTMTANDWSTVIADAASLGVSQVQLIGGEPTVHPQFVRLLRHAIDCGLSVEVFSNLVHVRDEWWELFVSPKVSLATSYYSDRSSEHAAVTGRRGSHARTRANIAEAVRRGIPVRVGIIDVLDGQRVEQARTELEALGVTRIGTDRLRGVGRGARTESDVSQLCGGCGREQAAISPSGDVWPCVLSRWLPASGNVRVQGLGEILTGQRWRDLVATIPARGPEMKCSPDNKCNPENKCKPDTTGCNPTCKPSQRDGSDCAPAEQPACNPRFCNPDTKRK